MEEILASIRRIIEDNDSERAPQVPQNKVAPEIAPAIEGGQAAEEIANFRAELGEVTAPAVAETEETAEPVAEIPLEAPPRVEPPVFQSRVEPPVLQMVPPVEQPAAKPAADLVSAAAGRKVAAAFGELSDAFAAQRRRSFDEIAEEMLRPMLRDWLDENLPTMVERLVREEIERIARGDRR
jgi:cell pole-organizing protein PopZ